MNVAHILCYNEAEIIGYTLRHYATFCQRIVLHDLGSTDGSQEIARLAGAEIVQWDCKQEFDDRLNQRIKNEEWLKTPADWVIMADADEFMYFPAGAALTLAAYDAGHLHVVKPYGYEMLADKFPTTTGQIYDEVKMGGRDDRWYAKPIMFSAKRVKSVSFSMGAHEISGVLKNGQQFGNPKVFSLPPTYHLHMHHIRSLEEVATRYNAVRARLSTINKQMRWGLTTTGEIHALEKRTAIKSRLERVVV